MTRNRAGGSARDSSRPGPENGHARPPGPGRAGGGGDPSTIRVLVADDHPIFLEGLTARIGREPGMTVVAGVSGGFEAVEAFEGLAPDLGLIDLRMPGLDGVGVVAAIREKDPAARLLILSAYAIDEDIYRALRAGAKGYLLKDMAGDSVIDALRAVHAGRTCIPPEIAAKLAERVTTIELTARERQVLGLVAKGKGNRDIGTELTVTEGTVKVHVNNILAKLGVASRTEAVTLALRRGLVRLED